MLISMPSIERRGVSSRSEGKRGGGIG
jgi:hypothetical protein